MNADVTMKERCIQTAVLNTPPNVRYVQLRKSLSGWAGIGEGSHQGCLCAPRPITRKSLYIFLHECAHFALHADYKYGKRPRYVEEFEAEQWAHARMREAGIPVPRTMTKRAKRYVAKKLRRVKRRKGRTVNPRLRQFAKA